MMKVTALLSNVLAATLVMMPAATGYPIYKFGLFQADEGNPEACAADKRRNKCFIWDLGEYPECYKFSETESYSGAVFDSTSLTYDLHPQCSKL